MPGRNRRVRLLALVVFGVVVFVLYSRNNRGIDGYGYADYKGYAEEKAGVGGGAVIRPKIEDIAPQAPPPPAAAQPRPEVLPEPVRTSSSSAFVQRIISTSATSSSSPPYLASSSVIAASSTSAPSDPTPRLPPVIDDEELNNGYQVGEGRFEVEVVATPTTSIIYWSKQPDHFPIASTIQLPTGTSKPFPRIQRAVKKLKANGADEERLAVIKEATQYAWNGYRDYAWAQDEIKPVSGRANNPFNGWGATLVDSLDTLWIMGMEEEFVEAVGAVEKIDFTTSPRSDIPIFETTIRYLGGLIAAYDVSGKKHRILLDKAVELAEVMYSIFDTPNRMPLTFYRWKPSFASQPHRAGNRVVLAELGTLSMEFTRLAQLTGEPKYYDAIARITDAFDEWQNYTRVPGMWPTTVDASGCAKPAQIPQEQLQRQQPVPDGSGKSMSAGEAVEAGENSDDLRRPQKGIAEDVAVGELGKGKTQGFGNPIEEGSLASSATKEKLLNDLGSSKRKRGLDGSEVHMELEQHKIVTASASNDTTHKNELRTPPEIPGTSSEICLPQGLASTSKNSQETFTLSGASDSHYEYLPKEYLLLGGQVDQYRTMYLASAATAIEKLLYKPMTMDERDILMSGELKVNPNYTQPPEEREYIERFTPEASHLTCFAGGMFAVGGVLFDKPEHLEIGSKLTDGCIWAYNVTQTGVMPEGAVLMACEDTWGDCPWDEEAYWKELDPYEETRTIVHRPVQTQVMRGPDAGSLLPLSPTETAVPEVVGPQQPKADPEREADDGSFVPLAKRQLGEASIDIPKPAQPATVPAANLAEANNDAVAFERPIYTPPAPLPHKEYVQKKIEDERLPPGYTKIGYRKYILRPEAIESVFYLYRITGDTYWRDRGWEMFTSIDRHTRTLYGNSAIDDMTKSAPELSDQMESFWVAETLKYFYLLFDEPNRWSLDEWVLNTEAHFFRRPPFEFAE